MRRIVYSIGAAALLATLCPVVEASAQSAAVDLPAPGPETVVGHRYGRLSRPERQALRRGFKLPMDALFTAQSADDLAQAAVVAPLPDPDKPLLAAPPAGADRANPFGGPAVEPADLMSLLFGDEASAAPADPSADALAEGPADDPFTGDGLDAAAAPAGGDPFSPVDEAPAEAETPDEAPEDLGLEDDPFADF